MDIQSKDLTQKNNNIIFSPLSIVASLAALLSIPSVYGAIACGSLGIVCGLLAIRNGQKMSGAVGIVLNSLVLIATAVMLYLHNSYSPE